MQLFTDRMIYADLKSNISIIVNMYCWLKKSKLQLNFGDYREFTRLNTGDSRWLELWFLGVLNLSVKLRSHFFYSTKLNKFTSYLSIFRYLEVLYLSNQSYKHRKTLISLLFPFLPSKSGRLYTSVNRVNITPAYLNNGQRRGLASTC